MNSYILIDRIDVQNANAISGFTWGFPAITHFLGFTHNLQRKLKQKTHLADIELGGSAVIAHKHELHTFKESNRNRFTQYKPSHFLGIKFEKQKLKPPAIIEEGKMNLTVSILIEVKSYVGNRQTRLENFIKKSCFLQRLAGGTVLSIKNASLVDAKNPDDVRILKNKLLPGFFLKDRSVYLNEYFSTVKDKDLTLFDAWLDFISLKTKMRPIHNLIEKHIINIFKNSEEKTKLFEVWNKHKEEEYCKEKIPSFLTEYFATLPKEKNKELLMQWDEYLNPTEKTNAEIEFLKKPQQGFLVPVMTGYKTISKKYKAGTIEDSRDQETDFVFVESVHSVGEWLSVHRIKNPEQLKELVWDYTYKDNWYLCSQKTSATN